MMNNNFDSELSIKIIPATGLKHFFKAFDSFSDILSIKIIPATGLKLTTITDTIPILTFQLK